MIVVSKPVRRALVGALIVVVAASIAIGMYFLTKDYRRDLTLAVLSAEDWQSFPSVPGDLDVMSEATASLCAGVAGCIEGYATPRVDYLRFDERQRAADYVARSADAYQSDWFVIVYRDGSIATDERTQLQEMFDGLARSD